MKILRVILLLPFLIPLHFVYTQTTVNSFQKISDTEGLFTATLDNDDALGRAVTSIGDLDNDGVNDIVVGAHRDDDGGHDKGAIYIQFLNTDGTVKAYQKISETQGGLNATLGLDGVFGNAIDTIGDLDGDGVVDLVVGAGYDSDGGGWHGAIWILFLNTNGTVKNHQKISDTQGGFNATFGNSCSFGSSVTGIGDFNGDTIPDVAVGVRRDSDGGTRRGAVLVTYSSKGIVKKALRSARFQVHRLPGAGGKRHMVRGIKLGITDYL